MKIYELEISNFKCLENYKLPFRFSNLNLLIGENDSGKTALLEAIEILLSYREIKAMDFYNPNKQIKIKARIYEINPGFLDAEMDFIDYDADMDGTDLKHSFEDEGINNLKNFSFSEDLRKFYLDYKDRFTIIIENTYWIENSEIKSKSERYFYNPTEESRYLKALISNKDFIDFMGKNIKEINEELSYLQNSNENIEPGIENYDIFPVFGLKSIAYRIAKIINSRLYDNFNWLIEQDLTRESLLLGIKSAKELGTVPIESFSVKRTFISPYVNYFGTSDLDSEKVCQKIYEDQIEALLNLEKTINSESLQKEIYIHLNNALRDFLSNKIKSSEESMNYFNDIKNDFIDLLNKLNINNIDLNIDFSLRDFDRLKKYIEPTLKISAIESKRCIDISNKSQGFLRKLLICDFLLLTKNLGSDNPGGRIILIEEPEIHMHINAQKEIIAVLKENMLDSDSQVFITSHSHTMIEEIDLEDIYVFKKDVGTGLTNINNLKQIGIFNRDEIINDMILSLGVKNTDLLFLKKVILLLEGPSDVAFIKGLCERPENAIDTEKILFKHTIGQASIFYYPGLGEFLNLKTMIIYDNHGLNYIDSERLKNNPYINDQLKRNSFKIEMPEKSDILDYFDFEYIAEYKKIPKEKIPQKNQNISMKKFLEKNNKELDFKDIEYLSRSMPKEPKEFIDKIINFLKLSLLDLSK